MVKPARDCARTHIAGRHRRQPSFWAQDRQRGAGRGQRTAGDWATRHRNGSRLFGEGPPGPASPTRPPRAAPPPPGAPGPAPPRAAFPGTRSRQRNLDLLSASEDVSTVNMKTLGPILTAFCLCVTLTGRASAAHSGDVVSLGNDTYSITCEAKNAFNRNVDKLKTDASDAAAMYCEAQGKQMRVISLTGDVPMFSLGYAKAKIVFRALNPGDPGLTSNAAPEGPAAAPAIAPVEKPLSTDDLYAALVKLDDLRKKGILTDDEFQAEKKKVLSKSK